MSKDKPVLGLADFQLLRTPQPDVAIMKTRDTKGKFGAYLVSPDALGVVLQQALLLADEWSDHPDLKPDTVTRDPDGRKNALPASTMKIVPGRHPGECVVELLIGRVELAFFVPLNEAVNASQSLARSI